MYVDDDVGVGGRADGSTIVIINGVVFTLRIQYSSRPWVIRYRRVYHRSPVTSPQANTRLNQNKELKFFVCGFLSVFVYYKYQNCIIVLFSFFVKISDDES